MNITSEVHFQTLIYPFRLSVGLWMIRCAVMQFGAHRLKQLGAKCTCEDSVSRRHNRAWYAI